MSLAVRSEQGSKSFVAGAGAGAASETEPRRRTVDRAPCILLEAYLATSGVAAVQTVTGPALTLTSFTR